MNETGNTTTSQLPTRQLELRFIERSQMEVEQMRSYLPRNPIDLDPAAVAQVERIAQHMSGSAESFGFPEIGAIAGAIELITHEVRRLSLQEKLELCNRLREQIAALEVHLQYEYDERMEQEARAMPMSAHLPGFGARHK
jgi:HPt (histidine-containing phosphotransfer) domain-containing protein